MTRTRFISLLASAICCFYASATFGQCIVWVGPPDKCVGGTSNGQPCNQVDCAAGGGTCQPVFGAWQYDGNWVGGVSPGTTDCVTIGEGKLVAVTKCVETTGNFIGGICPGSTYPSCDCDQLDSADATCASLTIESGAEVFADPARSLTLGGNATIDGELELYLGSTLKISADVTLYGTGELQGHLAEYDFGSGRIENAGSPVNTLTIGSGLTVRGRLVVDVAVTNNGTINADWLNESTGKGIVLQRAPITGTGTFRAGHADSNFAAGVLSLEATVAAGGTWILDTAGTSIVFDAASTEMTGDFEITTGTLKINQNLTTTGNLDITGGTLKVATNKKAEFSK